MGLGRVEEWPEGVAGVLRWALMLAARGRGEGEEQREEKGEGQREGEGEEQSRFRRCQCFTLLPPQAYVS